MADTLEFMEIEGLPVGTMLIVPKITRRVFVAPDGRVTTVDDPINPKACARIVLKEADHAEK